MAYAASNVHYERNGGGPPLLMVHGNPATHTLWRPIIGAMAGHRTVYAVDLPGFGVSRAPDSRREFALENLARVLLEFADLHGLDRFDLVGHSFGGAISATIAAMAPRRLRSLTLITPLGIDMPPLGRLAAVRFMPAVADALWRNVPLLLRGLAGRTVCRLSYGGGYTVERAREVAREVARRPDLLRSSSALMAQADLATYARSLEELNRATSLPLLLVGCGRDRIVPFRQFERVREKLSRAESHLFPDGDHVPIWQYPDELTALLERFLFSADHER